MRTTIRTTTVTLLSAALLGLGAGVAAAEETPASPGTAGATQGPDHTDVQPGPDYTNFQPGPDYTNFQPGPDYDAFQPGYAPGTADLVDDGAARVLTSLVRGLFG